MLKPVLRAALALAFAALAAWATSGNSTATTEFAGSTPCDEPVRRFLAISNAACQQVTWELSLSAAAAGQPFQLRVRYHMPIPSSPNHLDAGIEKELSGVWTSAHGTGGHNGRTIYSLTTGGRTLPIVEVERGLLHVLAADNRLMAGNAGWSYTLNRRDAPAPTGARQLETLSAGDSVPAGALAGKFEGRTPCREISKLLDRAFDSGCIKLKWGLALSVDPASGRPATYQLGGTVYRNGELQRATPRTGKWSLLRDRSSGALIHRLEQVEPGRDLLLMRADEHVLFFLNEEGNALVGNTSFSYTLNRAAR